MKVEEIVKTLNLKVFSGEKGLSNEINNGYVSDLLSDVMGSAEAKSLWITLQTHKNVMAIASLKELAAIILVKGNKPEKTLPSKAMKKTYPFWEPITDIRNCR
jgi:serine kinase of HPr protein (carbohydrate metabolism regulator)